MDAFSGPGPITGPTMTSLARVTGIILGVHIQVGTPGLLGQPPVPILVAEVGCLPGLGRELV